VRSSLRTLVLAALLWSARAQGNGAFPDEFSIHFPAGAPDRILVGANFGLLVTEDDGATWRYSCEPYVTSGSSAALSQALVRYYQLTADGAILANSTNVTRSVDVGCNWPTSGGSIAGKVVTDVFADPNDPSFVLAIVATVQGTFIVGSHDGGQSFGATLYSTTGVLTGIEISRSTPGVVYATEVSVNGQTSTLLRSVDSGLHWTPMTIPTPAGTQPRILAVDPESADSVYVRLLTGTTDAIGVTVDGGATFDVPLSITGAFSSFLRASDRTLYAGTLAGDLWVRPPGATSFQHRTGPHFRCLGQRPGTTRIYACADMILDGFSVGTSDDGAMTFQHVMKFTELKGPLTCPEVQTACAAHWARIQQVLGLTGADAGVTPPPDAGSSTGPATKSCASAPDGPQAILGTMILLTAFRMGSRRSGGTWTRSREPPSGPRKRGATKPAFQLGASPKTGAAASR
jgi:hypothetical protein